MTSTRIRVCEGRVLRKPVPWLLAAACAAGLLTVAGADDAERPSASTEIVVEPLTVGTPTFGAAAGSGFAALRGGGAVELDLTNEDVGVIAVDPELDLEIGLFAAKRRPAFVGLLGGLGEAGIRRLEARRFLLDDIAVPEVVVPDDPAALLSPPGFAELGRTLPGTVAGTGVVANRRQLGGIGLLGRGGPGPSDRRETAREELVRGAGGNRDSEAAVARGLVWLAKQQKPDGSWQFDGSAKKETVAATGMALLPFLARGETHKGGKYAENVKKGLAYLMGQLQPSGQFRGTGMYAQAIGTMALCEAYGLTADPALKPRAQAAVNFIVRAQHDQGGWRYQPGQPGDTSATGWQVQALHAARLAKLQVPEATLKKVGRFLDSVAKDEGAVYGYVPDSPQPTPTLTAVGLYCRQTTAGWTPKKAALARGVEFLKKSPPREALWDVYYYYYATQVFHLDPGKNWYDFWNPKMRDMLIKLQGINNKESNYGSWKPDNGQIGTSCGRLGTTALAVLTLEVYYRHLPLDQRRPDGPKEEKKP